MENIRLLAGMILVKQFTEESKQTAAGIFIPDTARHKQLRGTIVLAGKNKESEEMEVKVNDIVHFSEHAGLTVKVEDEDYRLIQQKEINYWVPANS